MAENSSPRQMARDLLQGMAPPRPLFLPIVFSLGARVENLPLRAFLTNPTKISNALRQVRSRLPADGVTCYFDPYLEVEALGAALRWQNDDQPPSVCWPAPARKGELSAGLRSSEEAAKAGRIGVATEVIRRLSSLLRDDTLLMAGVSGPFTLAAKLLQLGDQEMAGADNVPASALDLAAAMLTQVASAFVEAGAHVIFFHESALPRLSAESCEAWANLLSPTFNIVRFYDALPVLLLPNPGAIEHSSEVIAKQEWNAILCPTWDASALVQACSVDKSRLGIAVPLRSLAEEESSHQFASRLRELSPSIITTAGDVSASTDVKRLAILFGEVCSKR